MADGKLTIAVLISGRGSNLQALIDACADPAFPARIGVVVSNCEDAYGLERARAAGIPALVVRHGDYKGKAAFEAAIDEVLRAQGADLICLAGFMRLLSPWLIERWPNRIINIHPSLLPAYKGLDTHARALAAGEAEAGCSVHIVTAGVDEGPVLLQKRVPVVAGDTADSLAERVLAQEHQAYPEVVRRIARGEIDLDRVGGTPV